MFLWGDSFKKIQENKNTHTKHHNNDNNLFIQVEEESLAVKNTRTEGELIRTFWSEVLHGGKWLVQLGHKVQQSNQFSQGECKIIQGSLTGCPNMWS